MLWYTFASGGVPVSSDTDVSITDKQTLYAHWQIVTAPTIIGGSTEWDTSRTISVSTVVTANSGVDHYEYYYTTNSTVPTNSTSSMGSGTSVKLSSSGIYYVYFRTVSKSGIKSSWSNVQEAFIDSSSPVINNISKSFSIELGETKEITLTGISDNYSGIKGYYVTIDSDTLPNSVEWISLNSDNLIYSVSNYGHYYFWFSDNVDNISMIECNVNFVPVASVNYVNYPSVNDAVKSISTSGTVNLLKNRTESYTLPSGKTIILNLGNYTLTGKTTNEGSLKVMNGIMSNASSNVVVNRGTLEIVDATINCTAPSSGGISTYGDVFISSGQIIAQNNTAITTYAGSNVYISGTANLESFSKTNTAVSNKEEAILEVNGGSFVTYYVSNIYNVGNVKITDGVFRSDCDVIVNYNEMSISGGKFTSVDGNAVSNNGNLEITGGTFNGCTYSVYNNGTISSTNATFYGLTNF